MSERGDCDEPGPWGARCTEWTGHRWSHYDGSADRSWQDDWRDDTPPAGGGTLIEFDNDDETRAAEKSSDSTAPGPVPA